MVLFSGANQDPDTGPSKTQITTSGETLYVTTSHSYPAVGGRITSIEGAYFDTSGTSICEDANNNVIFAIGSPTSYADGITVIPVQGDILIESSGMPNVCTLTVVLDHGDGSTDSGTIELSAPTEMIE